MKWMISAPLRKYESSTTIRRLKNSLSLQPHILTSKYLETYNHCQKSLGHHTPVAPMQCCTANGSELLANWRFYSSLTTLKRWEREGDLIKVLGLFMSQHYVNDCRFTSKDYIWVLATTVDLSDLHLFFQLISTRRKWERWRWFWVYFLGVLDDIGGKDNDRWMSGSFASIWKTLVVSG